MGVGIVPGISGRGEEREGSRNSSMVYQGEEKKGKGVGIVPGISRGGEGGVKCV